MDVTVETAEFKKTQSCNEDKKLYSVEEVIDRIDKKIINYYGEYGRKIVNDRRTDWNQDEVVQLKLL
jgi:hypothetical protein